MTKSPRVPAEPRRPLGAPARASEEAHASDRHLAAMAQQLEAALRRPGATAHAREGATAEPPAIRQLGGEPRSAAEASRSSLMERVMQSRAAAAPARAKPVETPPPPEADAGESAVPASEGAPSPLRPRRRAPPRQPSHTGRRPSRTTPRLRRAKPPRANRKASRTKWLVSSVARPEKRDALF